MCNFIYLLVLSFIYYVWENPINLEELWESAFVNYFPLYI